ncbi:hypothetical protein Salat_2611800 [Sesamum alatum]|uniref:Uncharacterized protein n=1 Tax=Sesamum alatum TaxID=300844 RepID=A0AAE1XP77_9LAMI|nr:hypothetical protein Salat_2611800 [Sesamum alatum]
MAAKPKNGSAPPRYGPGFFSFFVILIWRKNDIRIDTYICIQKGLFGNWDRNHGQVQRGATTLTNTSALRRLIPEGFPILGSPWNLYRVCLHFVLLLYVSALAQAHR